MGLGDLVDGGLRDPNRYYPDHEWDEQLYEWAEEVQLRFPGGVEYDFIEVSPEMSRHDGFAYYKGENGFIRISEKMIQNRTEEFVKKVLIHELAHLWFYQNGYYQYSDGSGVFEWVLGRVGADLNEVGPGTEEYEIMEEFLEHEVEEL